MAKKEGNVFQAHNALFRVIILCAVIAVIVVVATILSNPRIRGVPQKCFKGTNCLELINIMDTEELRQTGLMGYDHMNPNQAMLFVFPKEETSTFWMKDVKFSIDLIWLNGQKRIV
ncbi:MAG: DUF192 domain-containing protein, partial [Candidatus Woesearchaeota archaeon]